MNYSLSGLMLLQSSKSYAQKFVASAKMESGFFFKTKVKKSKSDLVKIRLIFIWFF